MMSVFISIASVLAPTYMFGVVEDGALSIAHALQFFL